MSPEFAAEVTHSKCWGVLTHSPTPIKNTSILRQNLLHVKHPPKPRHCWPEPIFPSQSYPLSINTRKHPKNRPQNRHQKQHQNIKTLTTNSVAKSNKSPLLNRVDSNESHRLIGTLWVFGFTSFPPRHLRGERRKPSTQNRLTWRWLTV